MEDRPFRPIVPWYRDPLGLTLAVVIGTLVLFAVAFLVYADIFVDFPVPGGVED